MSSSPSRSDPGHRRETLVVAAMTAAGGLLRFWSVGRLGLVHFDEGIYAMAGAWAISPRGLAELDPTLIPYAPPGFPVLVGLAYGLFGVADIAAILVSILAGTLTIPVVGWLACRTFGRGAGAAASAFAALSGPHIAFSRMALTDATFLLAWLIALAFGQRFLERPGAGRAAAMGIAVGVAQLFKYNGWLAGAAVAVGAAIWTMVRSDDRGGKRQGALWGWGLFAVVLAAAVYWPWFRFVEANGGYAALLAHQRGYLGGLASWPGHLAVQLEQDRALSGGIWWVLVTGLSGASAMLIVAGDLGPSVGYSPRKVVVASALPALCAFLFGFAMMAACGALGGLWRIRSMPKAFFVVCSAWAVMAILTPFYRPYARLFLPFQATSWVLLAGLFLGARAFFERVGRLEQRSIAGIPERLLYLVAACWIGPLAIAGLTSYWSAARGIRELLEPSDSLRTGCRSIAATMREGPSSLRVYVRPPVTFYLAGTVPVAPQPTMDALLSTRDGGSWALVDSAMIRHERGARGRFQGPAERWDLMKEVATTLNWPTLLDIDPGAAARGTRDRAAPLMLFRPRTSGAR